MNLRQKRATPGERVEAALGPVPGYRDVSRLPYASPLSPDSTLSRLVWTDLFGDARASVNSRESAMRLGPVARGRNLLAGSLSRCPLVALRGETPLSAAAAPWTLATEDGSSWQHRMVWTVDDHIFYGWSLWHRRNGADGFPLAATHVNFSDWSIDDDNVLNVYGSPVTDPSEWCLIPGLHEGILSYGGDVLRDARDLFAIVRERLENTTPPVSLEAQPGAERLTPDEIRTVIATYKQARKDNGGVGYTNEWLKAVALKGNQDGDLLIDARNAAAVECARLIGIHAGLVDATAPKASLNYETTTGRTQEFVDFDLALYAMPIAARLSLDDFVPHGTRVDFDTSVLTGPFRPTGPNTED
jgi:hypothetical protein